MRFLFPGFLFALLALAIPILIHLFHFRKFRKVYFSNIRFLQSIEQQTSSRKNLKHRLILAARMLAVAFLVFAFARPYLPSQDGSAAGKQNVVSIFVDNSYSMEALNKEGSLFDEARRRAKEIASAYGLNDKFQLLTHDFEGRHQRLVNYDDFLNAVDEIKISGSPKNLQQILSRQQDIFAKERHARKTAYIISDFQKNLLGREPAKADSSVNVRLVQLKSNPLPNVSIDSLWFVSPIHKPEQAEKLVVKLRNNSDRPAENVPIKLLVNKQQKALGTLSIPARESRADTLSFSNIGPGWQAAEIQITDYPVVFDDRFFFSFQVQPNLEVLAINGQRENPYLQAVYRSDPYFSLQNVAVGNINYSQLGRYPLIILNELSNYSEGLIRELQAYVQKGGRLLIFPSLQSNLSSFSELLRNLKTDLPEQILTTETKVAAINLQHPVFRGVFEHIPQKLDLPLAKKYLRYSSQSKTNRQNLLELPGRQVFLSEYHLGKGKVFLSAVPLSDEAGNLPRHSVFVPIMYQLAMLSRQDQHLFYTLGQDQALELPKITLNANQTLKLRKDQFEAIPDMQQTGNASRLYLADQIKEAGNYELVKGDSLLSYLSFNDNGTESDLSYIGNDELLAGFAGSKPQLLQVDERSMQEAVKSVNQGLQLWKLCLILALFFLAIEILLIRFYKVKPPKPVNTL
ncbi:MAG TPA: BatA domain-containing protein [Daejeonella sp.]|nr:BatA domain-containing protein [Daejeonella sp.]